VSEVEIFTPTGVLLGLTRGVPLSNDGPDLSRWLALEDARWYPLDGTAPAHVGERAVAPDDILLIVSPVPEITVHMAWFPILIEVGPYRVSGQLPTHPGFDPARALARPGSTFIALSDAVIELAGREAAHSAERARLFVNRYAVERVTSTLMLGHFFPGARLVGQESVKAS
jgi:hypothetical protein